MLIGIRCRKHTLPKVLLVTLVMIVFNLLASGVLFLASIQHVKAVALTTVIAPNERLCFYSDVDKAGEKIGVSVAPCQTSQTLTCTLSSTLQYVLTRLGQVKCSKNVMSGSSRRLFRH